MDIFNLVKENTTLDIAEISKIKKSSNNVYKINVIGDIDFGVGKSIFLLTNPALPVKNKKREKVKEIHLNTKKEILLYSILDVCFCFI